MDVYDDAFKRSGFFGPLSFYRNMDTNWRRSKDIPSATLVMPIGFLTGALDPVRFMTSGAAESMGEQLVDFCGVTVLDGVGHWVQQEAPEQVNAALLGFLDSLA